MGILRNIQPRIRGRLLCPDVVNSNDISSLSLLHKIAKLNSSPYHLIYTIIWWDDYSHLIGDETARKQIKVPALWLTKACGLSILLPRCSPCSSHLALKELSEPECDPGADIRICESMRMGYFELIISCLSFTRWEGKRLNSLTLTVLLWTT